MEQRRFSLYDIEQFLRDAGAERINEKAVQSFEEELESTVKELVDGAEVYAKYAGRERLVTNSDIDMAAMCRPKRAYIRKARRKPALRAKPAFRKPVLDARGMQGSAVRIYEK